jgi:hypothetical protein
VFDADGNLAGCISGIMPGGDRSSVVVGVNFLRAWYTIYRYDNTSRNAYVGIAQSANAAVPSTR